jgi:transcriptional regulator with XRE-family HTH domain
LCGKVNIPAIMTSHGTASIASRLSLELDRAGMSKKAFWRALTDSKVLGTSYPAITRYLNGTTHPSADFVVAAAEVLQVTPGYLLTGDSPRLQAEADQHRQAFQQLPRLTDSDRHYWTFVANLPLGSGRERDVRRGALIQFAKKMANVSIMNVEMFDVAEREALIAAAGVFLVEVEQAFQAAARAPVAGRGRSDPSPLVTAGLLLGSSSSGGWWVNWTDAVLDLFARRVMGLGERSGQWADAHHPVGQDPADAMLSEYNSRRMAETGGQQEALKRRPKKKGGK